MKTLLTTLCAATLALSAFAASAADKEIAVIVKTVNSDFWQNVKKGANDGAAKLKGYTATFQGAASDTDLAGQVALVENAVNRKVAGIVLAPSDPDALIPAMKKAWEAKIPVILIDSAASDAGKNYYQSFLATDNKKAGELCAQALIDKIGKEGKIAIMSFTAGSGSEIGRVGGFRKYIETHSKLKIVGTFYSNSQMGTALNQTTDVLAANADLKGVFGANEPTAIGMGRALVQSGKAGKVAAIGFDGNGDLQAFVKDGTIEAIAVQSAYMMGHLGVTTVADVVAGKKVPKFLDTGVVMVTKKNIDTPEAKNVLY
ncbi:MAG TPA: ABC transporter substrate-binding protein [Piscinibacter sp.]|jgi:ribose transport system substrate-binding protein|uniref:ABC transporter substrate-binding protein n=1 Tax=Piscinibacter sp. TaxID=1903157 RepID=UPI001DB69CB0|nr:ABC transporter substrate-binding protein [Piscinibacter sp.]MBK7531603.1 ABC transporter substrate-binding protein [Piscinibacter sp.]HOY35062.1 ABC transporter substrate-binding protein [Piscinibacter sp.]HPG77760.1 ABC transporter substrate-binding protein [Piscinibacter sp.]HPM65001.1 ABC transporter substrate-binding protein [Piscinibacter sp.]